MNCPFYMVALGLGMGIGVARHDLILVVSAAFAVGLAGLWLFALVWRAQATLAKKKAGIAFETRPLRAT